MPKFLEQKLLAEYPSDPSIAYATMNKLGAMHGNKETAKGAAMQAKHDRDVNAGKASSMAHGKVHPGKNLGHHLKPKKRGNR